MKTYITIIYAIMFGVGAYALAGSKVGQNIAINSRPCCAASTSVKDDNVKIVYPGKEQTLCPIMGNTLSSKKLYVDYKGKRIYVCCPPCISEVKNDPEAAIAKIKNNGETVGQINK